MKKLDGVYVFDKVENLGKYASINANFETVAAFVAQGGLTALHPGKNEIDGTNAWVTDMEADLVPVAERKGEMHRAYFDIQLPLGGPETMGVARFDPSATVLQPFDETSDFGLYMLPFEYVTLQPGEFALFYPGTCVHAPACTLEKAHKSRKLVFKVRKV